MKTFLWVVTMILVVTAIYAGAVTFSTLTPMRPPYVAELIEEFTSLEFRPMNFEEIIIGLENIYQNRVVDFNGNLGRFIDGFVHTGTAIFYIIECALSLLTDLIYNALLAFKFVGAMFRLRPVV